MALSSLIVVPQKPQIYTAQLLNATNAFSFNANSSVVTNLVSLATIGANGARIDSILASNSDSSNAYLLVILFLPTGGTLQMITSVNVPASSGFAAATPPVQILNTLTTPGLPKDSNNNSYILVPASGLIYVGTHTQIAAGNQVSAIAVGGDF